MKKYKARIADRILRDHLEATGGVLIQGPKWCGKTTTASQQAKSILYMDDPDHLANNLQLADTNIKLLLKGETPRLIDEWQLVPKLWDAARFEIDHRDIHTGQFIFTGSSVPKEKEEDRKQIYHSGTGRFAWITMRTMSLWESGESTGEVSLNELFEGGAPEAVGGKIDLEQLSFLTCRGGWPGALEMGERAALRQAYIYLDGVVNSDISNIDDVRRDSGFMMRLIRSLARHQGAAVSLSGLRADIIANESPSMSDDTISDYLKVLKKIFLEEDVPAWNPNLRSRSAIRTSDTRYFTDPSIAAAAMGIGPKDLINDLNTFGLLFETLAVRDLRVYADALDGKVYHFRDRNGLECDTVIHRRNGTYGLVEIKIGGDRLIREGAETLKALAGKIDLSRMPPPSFMMVLTGIGNYAYCREDGVLVVPIGCLKD